MSDKYNGWTNYETWNVALWLDNEQGTSEHWGEQAQECYDRAKAEPHFSREERAAIALAEYLKIELDDDAEANGAVPKLTGFYADLLNAALSEVNWLEIAEHYIENAEKEEIEATPQ